MVRGEEGRRCWRDHSEQWQLVVHRNPATMGKCRAANLFRYEGVPGITVAAKRHGNELSTKISSELFVTFSKDPRLFAMYIHPTAPYWHHMVYKNISHIRCAHFSPYMTGILCPTFSLGALLRAGLLCRTPNDCCQTSKICTQFHIW